MASYHFPLQQLLDLRSRVEDQARCDLADTQRETCQQRDRLDVLSEACIQAAETVALAPGQPVHAAMLLNNGLHLAHLRAKTVTQRAQVEYCSLLETQRREQLLEAARNREVLERLKQRRRDMYQAQRAQVETRELEEAATLAFIRQKRNA